MNKETRAIVLGLFVVVVFALCLSAWRGPAREFRNIKGFQVEVKKTEGDETRAFHFTVPVSLLAQLTRLAHIDDALDGDIRAAWDKGDITPRELLDAADESRPDKPSVIKNDDATIEVRQDGDAILVDVRDDWDRNVTSACPARSSRSFRTTIRSRPATSSGGSTSSTRATSSRSATRTTRSRSRPSRRRAGCASPGSRASAISRCVPPARQSRSFRALQLALALRRPRAAISSRGGQPPRARIVSVPPPAQGQPRGLVSLGTGGARAGARGGQADLPLDRLLDLPLVPRHGARVVRDGARSPKL